MEKFTVKQLTQLCKDAKLKKCYGKKNDLYNRLKKAGVLENKGKEKACPEGKVLNIETGRCVKIGSPTYKKLVERGVIIEESSEETEEIIPLRNIHEYENLESTEELVSEDVNAEVIAMLDDFVSYYEIKDDRWRMRALQSAKDTIENYLYEHPTYTISVDTLNTLENLPGVGEGTIKKIRRFLENKEQLPKDFYDMVDTWRELKQIRDVGPAKARELINIHHVKSIEDLRDKVDSGEVTLSETQLLGLEYYDDLIRKIPHNEIEKIEKLFKSVAKKIGVDLMIVGSYRRNRPTSSDIDVIISNKNVKTTNDFPKHPNYLKLFIDNLDDIIVEDLKIGSLKQRKPKSYNTEHLIKTKFSPYVRKIDIKYYAMEDLIPAILYFTGSRNFNIMMRKKATKLGYLLNQYGLFKDKKKIQVKTEKDIFDFLKLKYVSPEQRI